MNSYANCAQRELPQICACRVGSLSFQSGVTEKNKETLGATTNKTGTQSGHPRLVHILSTGVVGAIFDHLPGVN